MVGELITLPLRLTGRAARFWWRTAEETVSASLTVAAYVIERAVPDPPSPTIVTPPVSVEQQRPAERVASPRVGDPTWATEPRSVPPAQEPAHVSAEPELVDELAEPGAEEGAGAELRIREPWEGYRHLSAPEVTARLSAASAADLAAVQLYESRNRRRQTILTAAARQLRSTQS